MSNRIGIVTDVNWLSFTHFKKGILITVRDRGENGLEFVYKGIRYEIFESEISLIPSDTWLHNFLLLRMEQE